MSKKSSEEANPEAPIHGDILDSIITHLPNIHLVPTSQVSKSWNRTVVSTSIRVSRIKPWLLLHTRKTRPPYSTTTHAFDPRSPDVPLHAAWHTVDAPAVWRTDPVVALVGDHVVVAGGACEFEDDLMSVEMLDTRTGTWDSSCPSMPEAAAFSAEVKCKSIVLPGCMSSSMENNATFGLSWSCVSVWLHTRN
ncbi:hypothetical protein Tsubulata_040733 [Turnera subulata]|uniref:F-box domain-containing protein n=1 Tax=Turnera subulata TaxID=218843 RepID=A0A9Q0JAY7_9ROSI|nr:hypothetical protein Tsubulata_040733 [Turnera subulata]